MKFDQLPGLAASLVVLLGGLGGLAYATNLKVEFTDPVQSKQVRVRGSDSCLGVRPGTPEPWCDVEPMSVLAYQIHCEEWWCCLDCDLVAIEPVDAPLESESESDAETLFASSSAWYEAEAAPPKPTFEAVSAERRTDRTLD